MIDLETMGLTPDAAIISIGAVFFDHTGLGREFFANVNLDSAIKAGGVVNGGTVMWWLGQGDMARAALVSPNPEPINIVLYQFSGFMASMNGPKYVWGNGAAFDNVVLASAYKRLDMPLPWSWRDDRCYRTLKELHHDVPFPEFTGVAHNALDDAKTQAIHASAILKKIIG